MKDEIAIMRGASAATMKTLLKMTRGHQEGTHLAKTTFGANFDGQLRSEAQT
jgi:hypothetical protein